MLVPCPRCDGRFVLDPFQQKADKPCPMCGGEGEIDDEFICDCGRPAVQVVNNQAVCLTLDCQKRVQVVQTTIPVDQALSEQDVDDAYGWGGWAGMH